MSKPRFFLLFMICCSRYYFLHPPLITLWLDNGEDGQHGDNILRSVLHHPCKNTNSQPHLFYPMIVATSHILLYLRSR